MDRKKGLGPNATRRWGRRMDRERQHSFGNVQGNEEVGGCNPEYKFAETYFDEDEEVHNWPPEEQLDHSGDLYWRFKKLNGGPYGSYKKLLGKWNLKDDGISVLFDRIQSDPLAPPSNIRVRVPKHVHGFPEDILESRLRNIAACDAIGRAVHAKLQNLYEEMFGKPNKTLFFSIIKPSQFVIQRKSVILNDEYLEVRMFAHLPSNSRRIDGRMATRMFIEMLPTLVERTMIFDSYDKDQFYKHIRSVEDQEYLRSQLPGLGLVAFIADGSVLPRESGISDMPFKGDNVQLFKSPESLKVTITLPNRGKVEGMGLRQGVTLIVGGGYHGKTTLLEALQMGIYNKVPGDGREFVVTSPNAVKVRAEDGRSVSGVDISTFIGKLPSGIDCKSFSSEDASGSTSQAAVIMESIEMGADLLFIDEDISAANFMHRDYLMDALVAKESEPITSFLLLVKKLHEKLNVSTILVSGSCGLFMHPADTVIQMNQYTCIDQTDAAKELLRKHNIDITKDAEAAAAKSDVMQSKALNHRVLSPQSFKRVQKKIRQSGKGHIHYGAESIDLSCVEQIVETAQTTAITNIIIRLEKLYHENRGVRDMTLREVLEDMYARWITNDKASGYNGLDEVNGFKPFPAGDCAMPRIFEVASAINRMRNLKIFNFQKRPYGKQIYSTLS
ncbi:hypothetical protein X943_004058 [Babesia divergens]|uniref:ATPase n=1 Tax=Babesia divergens TaxID=32595 RepID=A0AAD9LEJ4_BABDI|nr:hypothetical protein X943_004058 [Babesia divergens]